MIVNGESFEHEVKELHQDRDLRMSGDIATSPGINSSYAGSVTLEIAKFSMGVKGFVILEVGLSNSWSTLLCGVA